MYKLTSLPRIKEKPAHPGEHADTIRGAVMRSLVIFYSRTGNTERVAQAVADRLDARCDRIAVPSDGAGLWGYLRLGLGALRGTTEPMLSRHTDLAQHDLVVLASPVWAGKICVPMRSFLTAHAADLPPRIGLAMTSGDPVRRSAPFADFEVALGRAPVATLHVGARAAQAGQFERPLEEFLQEVTQ